MRALYVNNINNNSNANGNNNLNNNGRFVRIAQARRPPNMFDTLYSKLCSYDNLSLAFNKAKKGKSTKLYVIEFEKSLKENLHQLRIELLIHSYRPRPLAVFILRDPKTRRISKSEFRDRIVHHALCNIIEPLFDKTFIYDSYANRKGKGVLKAIKKFNQFKLRVSKNNTSTCYVLKADIEHYFETVDHKVLLGILSRRIKDDKIHWLIRIILSNYCSKGMPLGNLTSQFFANVYLNELDQFVKHKLRAKFYIRYVDDFVILNPSKSLLDNYRQQIGLFLNSNLQLKLHPFKVKILDYNRGIDFLGLKIFPHHILLKKRNLIKFKNKINALSAEYFNGSIDYDEIYDSLEGWMAYAKQADTYNLRKKIIVQYESIFDQEISSKDINRHLKHLK